MSAAWGARLRPQIQTATLGDPASRASLRPRGRRVIKGGLRTCARRCYHVYYQFNLHLYKCVQGASIVLVHTLQLAGSGVLRGRERTYTVAEAKTSSLLR